MSILEFLKIKNKKYPDRIIVKSKPTGKFFEKAKKNLLPLDLKQVNDSVFRITGEYKVNEKHKRKVSTWIKKFSSLNRDSQAIWGIINSTTSWRENFINALVECATNGEDPKIDFLYGALLTILEAHDKQKSSFLSEYKSIKRIFEEANKIDQENEKERMALKYTRDIVNFFGIRKVDFDRVCYDAILNKSKREWHGVIYSAALKFARKDFTEVELQKKLKGFVKENYGENNKKRVGFLENPEYPIIDEEFLSKINPEQKVEKLGIIERDEGNLGVYELFTRQQLKYETKILRHCVGNDDTYANKIRRGESRIFSVRDSSGIPIYTIEYDVAGKEVVQFYGKKDIIIFDNDLFNDVINVLIKSGVEVNNVRVFGMICFKSGSGEYRTIFDPQEYEYGEKYEIGRKKYLQRIIEFANEGFSNRDNPAIKVSEWDLGPKNSFFSEEILSLIKNSKNLKLSFEDVEKRLGQMSTIDFFPGSLVEYSFYEYEPDGRGWGFIRDSKMQEKETAYLKLESVGGDLFFGIRYSDCKPYKPESKMYPRFPELTKVDGEIRIVCYRIEFDREVFEDFIKFNFPKIPDILDIVKIEYINSHI